MSRRNSMQVDSPRLTVRVPSRESSSFSLRVPERELTSDKGPFTRQRSESTMRRESIDSLASEFAMRSEQLANKYADKKNKEESILELLMKIFEKILKK